jgi:hypothetical protein
MGGGCRYLPLQKALLNKVMYILAGRLCASLSPLSVRVEQKAPRGFKQEVSNKRFQLAKSKFLALFSHNLEAGMVLKIPVGLISGDNSIFC